MKKLIFLFVVLFFYNITLNAGNQSSVDELFKLANEKYKTGNYSAAIQLYKQIIKKGIKNGYVYFNLGNAYFKNKELGKAILNYERARIYIPDDKDVQYNLKYAELMRIDKFKKPAQNPFAVIIMFIYNIFSINTLFVLLVILLFLIVFIFLIRWFFKNNIHLNELLNKIFPYLIGIFVFFIILLTVKISVVENSNYAIVIQKEIDVKSGPGNEYTVMFNLHEGTKINIEKKSGEWVFISTPTGFSGWVLKSSIEKI